MANYDYFSAEILSYINKYFKLVPEIEYLKLNCP